MIIISPYHEVGIDRSQIKAKHIDQVQVHVEGPLFEKIFFFEKFDYTIGIPQWHSSIKDGKVLRAVFEQIVRMSTLLQLLLTSKLRLMWRRKPHFKKCNELLIAT